MTSLSLLVLKTKDVERLKAFYLLFGIDFVEEQHGNGPLHYSGQIGDLVLEVYPLPDREPAADWTTRLGFTVADLNSVVELIRETGATIVSEPKATEQGSRSVVRDPDGRTVEVYQT